MTTIQIRPFRKEPMREIQDSSTYNYFHRPDWIVPSYTYSLHIDSHGWEPDVQVDWREELRKRVWAIPTIRAMADLPRSTGEWISGGKQTRETALVSLLEVLVEVLENCTPVPAVVPTWCGGVQVEWHRNNVDFEIEAAPNGSVEYFFSGPLEEREGNAWDDIGHLSKYVRAVTASE